MEAVRTPPAFSGVFPIRGMCACTVRTRTPWHTQSAPAYTCVSPRDLTLQEHKCVHVHGAQVLGPADEAQAARSGGRVGGHRGHHAGMMLRKR